MKKLVKTAISVVLILSFIIPFAIPVSAAFEKYDPDRVDYTNPELDLSQYTVEQVLSMSKDEFVALLADFERVYGPFHTYETDDVKESVVIHQPVQKELEVQPQWKSGDFDSNGDYVSEELATHEMITQQAMTVMMNDVGFFGKEPAEFVAAILLLTVYSARPDYDENGNVFAGHFYHAKTGRNYLLQTGNTALTNTVSHYASAKSYASQSDPEKALEHIGRALHFIQDVCEPHHSTNVIAGMKMNVHGQFESLINQVIDVLLEGTNTAYGYKFENYNKTLNYNTVLYISVDDLVKDAANISYQYEALINPHLANDWLKIGSKTTVNAVMFSAFLLYKFAKETGTPLY